MRDFLLALSSVALLSLSACAQTETLGTFEKIQLKNAVLHVYNTNDVMSDASFIVEGKDSCKYMSDLIRWAVRK